jgi:hypothetical protein
MGGDPWGTFLVVATCQEDAELVGKQWTCSPIALLEPEVPWPCCNDKGIIFEVVFAVAVRGNKNSKAFEAADGVLDTR